MYKYIIIEYDNFNPDNFLEKETSYLMLRFKKPVTEYGMVFLDGLDKQWIKGKPFIEFDFERNIYSWVFTDMRNWDSIENFSLTKTYYENHVMEFESDDAALLVLELEEGV